MAKSKIGSDTDALNVAKEQKLQNNLTLKELSSREALLNHQKRSLNVRLKEMTEDYQETQKALDLAGEKMKNFKLLKFLTAMMLYVLHYMKYLT